MTCDSWRQALERELAHRPGRRLRPSSASATSAVLAVMLEGPTGLELLVERRAAELTRHAGQYALPGGRIDPSDGSPERAAVRETEEETGLPGGSISIHGRLPDRRTSTGWVITPVVATAPEPGRLVPADVEVAELVRLPVIALLDRSSYRPFMRRERGLVIRGMALDWRGRSIWGATALILRSLGRLLEAVDGPWR